MTGVELWGHGDNASFLRDATEDYRRKPVEKLSRARWRRVLRRWLFIVLPGALTGVSPFISWWVIRSYVILLTCIAMAYGIKVFSDWYPQRKVRKTYIYPAAKVLSRVTGTRIRRRDALAMIDLPPKFGEETGGEPVPVRMYLPDVALDPGMKKRIVESVGTRLGLPNAISEWTESGVPVTYVDLYPQAIPPKSISLDELMEELLASDIDHPVVGVMTGGRVVRMDFRNDSPHTLGSAGSGAGKSTLYKFIAMQRMRRGAYAVILDFKKWSHLRWAGRLPSGRVRIEDQVPQIHDILGRILDELLWRKSFDLHQEAELLKLPRLDVYVEEINTLMSLLVDYWKAEVARMKQEARTALRRAKEAVKAAGEFEEVPDELLAAVEEAEEAMARAMGLPVVSPAIQAIRYGVNLGREFGIHFHFIGQSVSAKAAGGRDTRESFRTRLLARWDRKTWKMLADGIPFVACPSGEVGIWAHVHGSEYEIVRVPYVPDEFAVEFVRGGESPSLPMFHDDPVPTIEAESVRPAVAASASLRELVDMLPLKADGDRMTLEGLRTASKRDGFPVAISDPTPGRAALYDVEEVMAWFTSRSLGS